MLSNMHKKLDWTSKDSGLWSHWITCPSLKEGSRSLRMTIPIPESNRSKEVWPNFNGRVLESTNRFYPVHPTTRQENAKFSISLTVDRIYENMSLRRPGTKTRKLFSKCPLWRAVFMCLRFTSPGSHGFVIVVIIIVLHNHNETCELQNHNHSHNHNNRHKEWNLLHFHVIMNDYDCTVYTYKLAS